MSAPGEREWQFEGMLFDHPELRPDALLRDHFEYVRQRGKGSSLEQMARDGIIVSNMARKDGLLILDEGRRDIDVNPLLKRYLPGLGGILFAPDMAFAPELESADTLEETRAVLDAKEASGKPMKSVLEKGSFTQVLEFDKSILLAHLESLFEVNDGEKRAQLDALWASQIAIEPSPGRENLLFFEEKTEDRLLHQWLKNHLEDHFSALEFVGNQLLRGDNPRNTEKVLEALCSGGQGRDALFHRLFETIRAIDEALAPVGVVMEDLHTPEESSIPKGLIARKGALVERCRAHFLKVLMPNVVLGPVPKTKVTS